MASLELLFREPTHLHGKISPSMYSGSMVGAGAMAFALMPYCIANARPDEDSSLDLNPVVLASIFGESVKSIKRAIEYLASPDPKSRSPDEEGRRLIHVGPGPFRYKVVNLEKYRADEAREYRTEYWRQHKTWQRNGRKGVFKFDPLLMSTPCPQVSTASTLSTTQSTVVHLADAGTDAGTYLPLSSQHHNGENPSWEMVKMAAEKMGLVEWKAKTWFDEMEGVGWKDKNQRPICKWISVLTSIKTWWEADGRPMTPTDQKTKRYGTATNRQNNTKGFDRAVGTHNEGKAERYDIRKVEEARAIRDARATRSGELPGVGSDVRVVP